jgi:hypothetical protein
VEAALLFWLFLEAGGGCSWLLPPFARALRAPMPPQMQQYRPSNGPSTSQPSSRGGPTLPSLPSLAARTPIDAPRGTIMSARSRRLSTLPTIPEWSAPELDVRHVQPHLEELDTFSFSSLTQQLMLLCDTLEHNSSSIRPSAWRRTPAPSAMVAPSSSSGSDRQQHAPPPHPQSDPASSEVKSPLGGTGAYSTASGRPLAVAANGISPRATGHDSRGQT